MLRIALIFPLVLCSACSPVTFIPTEAISEGVITGGTFQFPNAVYVSLDCKDVHHKWTQYFPTSGETRRPKHAELRVQLTGGEVVMTDRDQDPSTIRIGSTEYKGESFLLHPDGSVTPHPPPPR